MQDRVLAHDTHVENLLGCGPGVLLLVLPSFLFQILVQQDETLYDCNGNRDSGQREMDQ
jgi:hypothetical protein